MISTKLFHAIAILAFAATTLAQIAGLEPYGPALAGMEPYGHVPVAQTTAEDLNNNAPVAQTTAEDLNNNAPTAEQPNKPAPTAVDLNNNAPPVTDATPLVLAAAAEVDVANGVSPQDLKNNLTKAEDAIIENMNERQKEIENKKEIIDTMIQEKKGITETKNTLQEESDNAKEKIQELEFKCNHTSNPAKAHQLTELCNEERGKKEKATSKVALMTNAERAAANLIENEKQQKMQLEAAQLDNQVKVAAIEKIKEAVDQIPKVDPQVQQLQNQINDLKTRLADHVHDHFNEHVHEHVHGCGCRHACPYRPYFEVY